MATELVRFLLLTQLASTLYMTGVIWLVQVVHYPLFERVGASGFASYEQRHTSSITWVVAPPMLIEGGSALLLPVLIPSGSIAWALGIGLALLIAIWVSTAFVQIPCHQILAKSFDSTAHRRLTSTNWLRTLAWTIRAALVLWLAWSTLR